MSQRYLGGVITANPTTPTMTTESGVWTLEQQFQNSATWSPEIVGNSLRLRSSASAYLSRTPASTSNQKTFTISCWLKRGALSGDNTFFCARQLSTSTPYFYLSFDNSTNILSLNSNNATLYTTSVYRDPSAWYHVVYAVDTTQATAANRIKLYVNGSQITTFGTATYPSLNADMGVNSTIAHWIGVVTNGIGSLSQYFDGYLAEIYFVDGQALTPSSFGAFDTNGVWQPLAYTGTFGTNGFYIDFSDNSAATAAALGKDYSGNGNNWTPNNISLTAGSTYDWMLDSPTNAVGTSTGIGNYATLNPLMQRWAVGSATITAGNLQTTTTLGSSTFAYGTIGVSSGKWYWEGLMTAAGTNNSSIGVGDLQTQWGTFTNLIEYNKDGTHAGAGGSWATYTTNDVIGMALDCDGSTIAFYKNGTLQGSVSLTAGVTFFPLFDTVTNGAWAANFGQRPFAYTPPTGYKALNTQNLPSVNINNGAQYMAATLYTGTGASLSISNGANNAIGTTFQPDLVWMKSRGNTQQHMLQDSVRGVTKFLSSNLTAAEATNANTLTAFNSNGFTLGSEPAVNQSTISFVGWQWQAGQGVTSSNTSGSITSTVSVNATAGFSVVTYTGTGVAKTVGHGLGVKPSFIIVKNRVTSTINWRVYHASLGATKVIYLSSTAAAAIDSTMWNNTEPTSSVFSVGTDEGTSGAGAGEGLVAYCWSEVSGYSKFGSYTGNGSADGAFIYTGFRPRYVLVKRTDTTGTWYCVDSSRNGYNATEGVLYPNLSNAESTIQWDLLSNGFKMRDSGADINGSGGTYIFAAFAENPFNISRAR